MYLYKRQQLVQPLWLQVEELWRGDQTPKSTRMLSRGISLFPQRPPLQARHQARQKNCTICCLKYTGT